MKEIIEKQRLLVNGNIKHPGYAKKMYWQYDRKDIKASKWRIKEWDYYLIMNDNIGIALTMDDNGYMGLMSISVLDFREPKEKTVSKIIPFTFGKIRFPNNSKRGKIEYKDDKCDFCFNVGNGKRQLHAFMKNFEDNHDITIDIDIFDEPEESMVIATPFKKKYHFYYNQKINCMHAKGIVKLGNSITKINNAYATLDWGRGVWTYHNTWIWGSANGNIDGHDFGFNIGYGFGDTSAASENMLFYDGKAHKLEHITCHIPTKDNEDDFMSPWSITSSDKRFEMLFEPLIDRAACTDIKIIKSDQHQVFGYYTGDVVLDDGTKIHLDKLLGFCEKVENKW